MNRKQLKEEVIKLRRQQKTYSEIQKSIGVSIPKSTLSYWCKDISLPKSYYTKIKGLNLQHLHKNQALAVLANKRKQEQLLENLRDKNKHLAEHLTVHVYKLLLSILYLGEGSKHKNTRQLVLGNSDPKIIQLYLALLAKCFPVSRKKFRVGIGCRADQDIQGLKEYWHSVTKIPLSQFHKPQIDRRTIGKKTKKESYKGVCRIIYFDTKIQLELEQLAQQIIEWVK